MGRKRDRDSEEKKSKKAKLTMKEKQVETHQNNSLQLANENNKTILDAFGQEVHIFMHCHLRGYDLTGRGKEMSGHYYDKYGAPVDQHESWSEGYRAVEKELSTHFVKCTNPSMEQPLIAGYGGGVHLYKPIKNHDTEPWNITGWIPLESKWVCEAQYFRNRHFFALRGNEIQNDLWDYHPYKEDWSEDCEDSEFSQYVPLGPFRGGYWYHNDARGRYLHIISLKNQTLDENQCYDRYNFIVHPLAFRASIDGLPDNSVDGMQWSITNIKNEKNFSEDERFQKWGETCHGIEIFNDFTYYYSWQPGEDGIFNGTLMNYARRQKTARYHFWFNTYPLEFGEFLLDSALTMGTYLHPISANDAFYGRATVPISEVDPEAEGMEKILLADPKGTHIKRRERVIKQESCSNAAGKRRDRADRTRSAKERKEIEASIEFRNDKPYGEDTVFGYQTLVDPHRKLRDCVEKHPPPNVIEDDDDLKTGLNIIEHSAIKMMQEGQMYGHTGVFEFFAYSGGFNVPFLVPGQVDQSKLCYDIPQNTKELIFVFPTIKEIANPLIWRYQIQTAVPQAKKKRSVLTTYGYFKMSTNKPTHLDLSTHSVSSVCWVRFSAFKPDNPQERAWFAPIKGPAFAKQSHEIFEVADCQPEMNECIMTTTVEARNSTSYVKEGAKFTPTAVPTKDLTLVFSKCSFAEQDDIFAYFFQSYAMKQPLDKYNPRIQHSQVDPNDPSKPLAKRIMECVHGYFQLCDEYPSMFNLCSSWDETSVLNQTVNVYSINNLTAQPATVDHLVLTDLPGCCRDAE